MILLGPVGVGCSRDDVERITHTLSRRYDDAAGPLGERIVLYGAGKLGRETFAGLRRHGIEPLAFVDTNPLRWGDRIDGLIVVSPEESRARWAETAAFVVAVSAGTALREALRAAGCVAVVPYTCLWWKFPETFLPLHGICRPDATLAHAEEIRRVEALWADRTSFAAYRAQIEWRLTLDYTVLPSPTPAEHTYFLPEIALLTDERFVDVGAYDGDTLREFYARVPNGRAVALEPDPRNWDALVRSVDARTTLHRVAAASRAGTLAFRADGTAGAAVCAQGEVEVRAERLDDLLAHENPTFLKFDVEGAELDALRGAIATIRRHRPVLAVCLYHKPEDLWEIPLLIASLDLGYRLLFRVHAEECWESVLYAVPPDRLRP